jgi:polysaccharide pyruvyl transferase WcaK-like protein
MKRGKPTIAFFGLFGVGNFGNEASLRAAQDAFREITPSADQLCICADPATVEAEHDIPAFSIRSGRRRHQTVIGGQVRRAVMRAASEPLGWVNAIRLLRRVDAVVVPGTGILDDFGVRPWQMPYDLFRWAVCTRLAGAKLVYLSIGAGPICSRWSRVLMRASVRLANYCSYRDETSRRFMSSIGRDVTRDPVYPDLAFTLPVPSADEAPMEKTIAIGVMSYYGWSGRSADREDIHQSYLHRVTALCSSLLAAGYRLRLLSGENSDAATVARLKTSLELRHPGSSERVETREMGAIDAVMDAIAGTELVIATRFHNVVAALMMNRPVISLGYAAKNQDLLERMGLKELSFGVEDFEPDAVAEKVDGVLANAKAHRKNLSFRNAEYRALLHDQYERVGPVLARHGRPSSSPSGPRGEMHNSTAEPRHKWGEL